MTPTAPPRAPRSVRASRTVISRDAWEAIRAACVRGEPTARVAASFGVSPSTIRRRARNEGWFAPDAATPSHNAILGRVFAAADAALARTAEALQRADTVEAEEEVKLAERLARAAAALAQARARLPEEPPADVEPAPPASADPQSAVIDAIERTLGGARAARRADIAALEAHGVDPRHAWFWDDGEGEWRWDPGAARG